MTALILTAALLLGLGLTAYAIRYAKRAHLHDMPNDRSLHSIPTPRGGGISIVVPTLLAAAGILHSWPIVLSSLLIAAVGWWDDHRSLDFKIRLAVQTLASVAVVMLVSPFASISIGGIASSVLLIFFLIWMTNLYNFMDGMDGFAASEAIFIGLAAGALFWVHHDSTGALGFWVPAFSAIGFCYFNWRPAKIFMGDVGSLFLGFYFTALAISRGAFLENSQGVSFCSFLILTTAFLVDATYTLMVRGFRGEKVYVAHRDHAYQHAVLNGLPHDQVVRRVLIYNFVWLAPLAWLADQSRAWAPLCVAAAFLPYLMLEVWMKAGIRLDANAHRV